LLYVHLSFRIFSNPSFDEDWFCRTHQGWLNASPDGEEKKQFIYAGMLTFGRSAIAA